MFKTRKVYETRARKKGGSRGAVIQVHAFDDAWFTLGAVFIDELGGFEFEVAKHDGLVSDEHRRLMEWVNARMKG